MYMPHIYASVKAQGAEAPCVSVVVASLEEERRACAALLFFLFLPGALRADDELPDFASIQDGPAHDRSRCPDRDRVGARIGHNEGVSDLQWRRGRLSGRLGLVHDLLRENLAAGTTSLYLTPPDLDFWIAQEDPGGLDSMRLWFEGDTLVGFAWPGDDVLDFVSHHAHREVEREMLAWGARPSVDVMVDDAFRRRLLTEHGFESSGETTRFFELPLPAPLPDRDPRVREAGDVAERVALLTDVQPHLPFDATKYEQMRSGTGFRRDLDLVADAPDGRLAAGVNAWFDAPSRVGVFEPLGCREEFRRQGYMRAVLAEALRRLEVLGAVRVIVQAAATNVAACALHESLGFREVARKERWVTSSSAASTRTAWDGRRPCLAGTRRGSARRVR